MTGYLLDTLSQQLTGLADRLAASVVAVHGGSGPPSSAVVWRPGLLVAAEDRLDVDDRITVQATDGRPLTATLVGRDPGTNVTLLRLEGDAGLVPTTTGDADALHVGQAVLAVGVRDGGRALLPPTATPDEIVTALRAAAAGLIVVHPALAGPLRTGPAPGEAPALTAREIEILAQLAEGIGNKSIARRLDISEHTVKFHLSSIMAKLGARSRTEAVMLAARLGLLML